MGISKASDHIQIKIKIPNPNKESAVSPKALNKDWKDMDVLYSIKIKIENQNLYHECLKDHWPYPNQDQDAKP